jgi:dipeptidyl-peptidase-3
MSTTPLPATERPYLLERIDDAAVVQIYADGFDDLPIDDKRLAWHLYRAALAGRDIYYDQRYAHNLEMREALEEMLTHAGGIEPGALAEIERYTKLFWLNTGPYNNLTARKTVLRCSPEAFARAARAARAAGAVFPLAAGETLDQWLARLGPAFFDVSFEPLVTNKTPGEGRDILLASANNLYDGVAMADLEGFEERHGLNSRLVKRNGTLVEEAYRVGGRYGGQIAEIVRHLEEGNSRGLTLVVVTHDGDLGRRARHRLQLVDGKIVSEEGALRPVKAAAAGAAAK